jgi:hypothetical protein
VPYEAREGPWAHYGTCEDRELIDHCREFGATWTPECFQHPLAPNLWVYVCKGERLGEFEDPDAFTAVYAAGGAVLVGGALLAMWWLS